MYCQHAPGGRDWLSMQNGVMGVHPFCGECGTVKNVSSDRGKKLGYFIRCLSGLRNKLDYVGYHVSDAQIRLICNELEGREEFQDLWWVTFSRQKEIYVNTVQKYVRVSQELIEESV
ncbi:MAG: hypothetical protein ACLFVX_10675 [Archaeoglobaceae archaeon]